eukprot:jgi/Psemu1/302390/fgenesh1_kg.68_\
MNPSPSQQVPAFGSNSIVPPFALLQSKSCWCTQRDKYCSLKETLFRHADTVGEYAHVDYKYMSKIVGMFVPSWV